MRFLRKIVVARRVSRLCRYLQGALDRSVFSHEQFESVRKFSRLEHLFDASLLLLYFLLSPSVEAKKRRVVKVSGESGRGPIMQNYPVGQIGRSSFPSRIACCKPAELDSIFRRILSAISTLSVIGS